MSQRVSNEYFDASITPNIAEGFRGDGANPLFGPGSQYFNFSIINKTDKNIEINWNKTLFISRGQTSGGFMLEGMSFKDRNEPKPPDIVFAKSSLTKNIFPIVMVSFSSAWWNINMPEGESGVYLSVIVDGKEYNDKITVKLISTAVEKGKE